VQFVSGMNQPAGVFFKVHPSNANSVARPHLSIDNSLDVEVTVNAHRKVELGDLVSLG